MRPGWSDDALNVSWAARWFGLASAGVIAAARLLAAGCEPGAGGGQGGAEIARSGKSPAAGVWKKHVIFEGEQSHTALAADFTGDGIPDVVAVTFSTIRLFVGPDWKKQAVIYTSPQKGGFGIHGAGMDVDGDGKLDYICAEIGPRNFVHWLHQPADPLAGPWQSRLVDDAINGTHSVMAADVDGDSKPEILANGFMDQGPLPNTLTWQRVPARPLEAARWDRFTLGDRDAPGGSHYFGFGDVDGDGRPDVAIGAKGETFKGGDWFAWWKQPTDPTKPWRKFIIAENQIGATNIIPAKVNRDGSMDFIASRGHGKGVLWIEGPHWKIHEIDADLTGPHCLAAGDLDGDGDIDAATCAKDDKLAVWYENDGDGRFTRHVLDTGQSAYDIRMVDMDGDGDLDLLVAGQTSRNIVWYQNPTLGKQ